MPPTASTFGNFHSFRLRPLQNLHLWRISALCVYALWVLLARLPIFMICLSHRDSFVRLAALLRLELHPHLEVLQRSQAT
nr:hypothetical protein [Neisseria shayeganii]